MSITQISKIQIRRGRKLETGLPQLASAEMAWAVDTRELFIGNGSVKEGARSVGNTKILTEYDDLFAIAETYQYRKDDGSIWNSQLAPVIRTLQSRLDDRITNFTFDIKESGSTDQFQRTIDQLYDNLIVGQNATMTLNFLPGIYIFDAPIKLPSWVSIDGAGIGHTILKFQLPFQYHSAFETKFPADGSMLTYEETQPKFSMLSNFTLQTTQNGMNFTSIRDSIFENIKIEYVGDDVPAVHGIVLNSQSDELRCKRNVFRNIQFKSYGTTGNFHNAIYGTIGSLISENTVDGCNLEGCQYGIVMDGGASQNIISNNIFRVVFSGIKIANGSGNVSSANKFYRYDTYVLPPIAFPVSPNGTLGNISTNDFMEPPIADEYFPPLVTGDCDYDFSFVYHQPMVVQITTAPVELYRLPLPTASSVIVKYTINEPSGFRKGTLEIVIDPATDSVIDTIDECTSTGNIDLKNIVFDAVVASGNISVRYTSPVEIPDLTLKYTYRIS